MRSAEVEHDGAASAGTARARALDGESPATALLEREAPIARLGELTQRAARGHGTLATILGRPGEGKTALLSVVPALAERDGLRVRRARGGELERDFAFGVLRQLLEPDVRALAAPEQAALLEGAARPAANVFGLPATGLDDGPPAVIHGLYWALRRLAAQGPMLLMIDDAHWADETSLAWLSYLLGRIDELHVLVVLAMRPPTADSRLEALCYGPGAELLPIGPLSPASTGALIERAFGTPPDTAFAQSFHAATAGNPFAISELLGELRRLGLSADANSAVRLELLAPASVQRNARLRLGRLDATARAAAEALAVLGGGAPLRHVAQMAGADLDACAAAADRVIGAGILEDREQLRFLHPLLHAAVYEAIGVRRRARLHALAASMLAGEDAGPQAIAAHLLRCDPAGDAASVASLRAAAREALAQGAPTVAAVHLRRALAEPPLGADRIAVLTELGRAEWMSGSPDAITHLQAARALSAEPEERIQINHLLADACCYAGRLDLMSEALSEAITAVADRDSERVARMRTMGPIARAVANSGWSAAQDAEYERLMLELAGFDGPRRALMLTLRFVGALNGRRSPKVAELDVERALDDEYLSSSDPGRGMSVSMGLFALVFEDRTELATQISRRVLAHGERAGAARIQGVAHHALAIAELHRGALAASEASARASLDLAAGADLRLVAPLILATLAELLIELGRVDEAERQLLGIPLDGDSLSTRFFGRMALAHLHRARGDRTAAIAQLETVAVEAAGIGLCNPNMLPWRSDLGLLVADEQPDRAQALAEDELRDARRLGLKRPEGVALRARARAERGAAREATLREAIGVLEGTHARLDLARALIDLGGEARRRGQRSAAREPLRRALELASQCGAEPLVQRAGEELRAADGRPRRPWLSGVEALTPSELRVAQRAADGLSNREIAEALFITTKTVEMHLTNAYRKLMVDSREQLSRVFESDR